MIPKDHKSGPGEIIGAAGLGVGLGANPRSIGMSLLRLHSEWSSAAKPRKLKQDAIDKLREVIEAQDAREKEARIKGNGELARLEAVQVEHPDFDRAVEIMEQKRLYQAGLLPMPEVERRSPQERAQAEAMRWHINELRILSTRLKSRPAVIQQLNVWAVLKGIQPEVVALAVHHWLAETCPVCDGHGFMKVPSQPALSTKRCEGCEGSGHADVPQGTGKVLKHIEYCLDQARGQLRERLRRW
jgi:hypothetical protein